MSNVQGMANSQVPMGHWGLGLIWSLVIGHLSLSIGHRSLVIVLIIWAILAAIASLLHPIVLFIGFAVLAYQLLRGFIQQRERKRLIDYRRDEDLCVRCGEPIDHTRATCFSCGQEPDPAQLKRIASVVKNRDDYTRNRSVLTPQRADATVKQREQALLQRRRERRQH